MLALLAILACGARNPIDDCGSLSVDCCESDANCADYYGPAYPYCYAPGDQGVCAECFTSADCNGASCIDDPDLGAYCDAP